MFEPTSNVVRFKSRASTTPQRHPRSLMEAVYATGSLSVPADDMSTKMAAAVLEALGFFVIEEIQADGTLKTLARHEIRQSMRSRPWRISKPPFAGEVGVPDAGGAFANGQPA